MRFDGLTDIGLKREKNEDAISLPAESDGIKLFILADGMGGAKAGEKASQLAVQIIRDYVRLNFIKIERTKEKIEEVIRKAMVEANKKIYELSMEYEEYNGRVTTRLVVHSYRKIYDATVIKDQKSLETKEDIKNFFDEQKLDVANLVQIAVVTGLFKSEKNVVNHMKLIHEVVL